MNEEVQMVVIDEAHNLEDRVRSATTERHGQRQLINAINASVKSVRGEDREYILEEADSAIRAVRALFQNLDQQIRQQIEESVRDMKYADRFFFRQDNGAVDLIRSVSGQLQALSSSIQVFGSKDHHRGTASSAADDWMRQRNPSRNWWQITTSS